MLERIYAIIGEHKPTFDELVEKIEGKPCSQVDKERVHYLNRWVQDLVKQGFAEYDDSLRLHLTEKTEMGRNLKS
jgi:hypothetical protein